MKNIVVPTNFSAASANAVRYAANLAMAMNANLYILHFYQLPLMIGDAGMPAESINMLAADAEEEMQNLENVIRNETHNGLRVYTRVEDGYVASKLEEYCDTLQPFAVVMGPEESDALGKILAGAKTIHAARHLHWPLIVVPAGATFKPIHKIALASDFRKVPETLPADLVERLVAEFSAELHIIYASSDSTAGFDPETTLQSAWMDEIMGHQHPAYHFLYGKNIEETITAFAEKQGIDLLIIIPKKHGVFHELFGHDHSKSFLLQSQVPVVLLRTSH